MFYGYLKGANNFTFEIHKEHNVIGRDKDQCDIVLKSQTVSPVHARLHCKLIMSPEEYYNNYVQQSDSAPKKKRKKLSNLIEMEMEDASSLNGTFVNHERLVGTTKKLRDGDLVRFGYEATSYIVHYNKDFDTQTIEQKMGPTNPFEEKKNPPRTFADEESPPAQAITLREDPEGVKEEKPKEDMIAFNSAEGVTKIPLEDLDKLDRKSESEYLDSDERRRKNGQITPNTLQKQTAATIKALEDRILKLEQLLKASKGSNENEQKLIFEIYQAVLNHNTTHDQNRKVTDNMDHTSLTSVEQLKYIRNFIMQKVDKEKNSSTEYRRLGIERYAAQLQLQNSQLKLKLDEIQINEKELQLNNNQALVSTLQQQLAEKDQILKEFYKTSNLTSNGATLNASLIEYEMRARRRANEWTALLQERNSLVTRIQELQSTINRQVGDVQMMLNQKEQKLNEYKGKILSLFQNPNVLSTSQAAIQQQQSKFLAAQFIVEQLKKEEQEHHQTQAKLNETSKQLYMSNISLNELKLEVNQLKDILQYSDIQKHTQMMTDLRDRIKELETECNIERVVDLKQTITHLSSQTQEYRKTAQHFKEEFQNLIKRTRLNNLPLDEDLCISFLEKLLQEKETKIRTLNENHQSPFLVDENQASSEALHELKKRNKKLNDIMRRQLESPQSKTVTNVNNNTFETQSLHNQLSNRSTPSKQAPLETNQMHNTQSISIISPRKDEEELEQELQQPIEIDATAATNGGEEIPSELQNTQNSADIAEENEQ